MTRLRWLVALGLCAFLLLLTITFPAQIVAGQLGRFGLEASGVSGSVWKGQASLLRVRGVPLGRLTWDLEVLKLLTGQLAATVDLRQDGAFAAGQVAASVGGRISLSDITASWPLARLAGTGMPTGWTGTANAQLSEVVLENGVPTVVSGTVDVIDLVGPANRPASLGSYRATFPPDAATAEGFAAELTDLDGPLDLTAMLTVERNRSFLVDGQIATRPDAPAQVISALQYLGEPDANGRRPFSLSGTF